MKQMYRRILFALFVATMPLAAIAQQAFTLRDVEVFAGPSSDYPPVAALPPGTSVQLAGCLSDWSWCDVFFPGDRGWVWAGDLGYPYQGNRVVIIEYGSRLRLPVVTFSLVTYWDAHYRARPWFRERDVWVNRVHIEADRGGPPPHGRQAQARPEAGAQQPAQRAQPAQPAPQPQAAQPARPAEQARPTQPAQPQARAATRPEERTARQPQRPPPEAGQAPQGEQREGRARPAEENRAPSQGTREQRTPQAHEAAPAPNAARQPEAMRSPDADREKRADAKEAKRAPERPKEEGRAGG